MRTCSKCGVGPLFNLGLEIPGPVLCSKCIREAGETPVDLQSAKLEDGDYIVTDFSDARVYEVCSKLMTPRAAEPSARKRLFWYTPKNAEKPHAFEFADDLPRFQTSESGQQAPNAGIRHDQDKLAWNLVPMEHLEGMVRVLMFGAKKYAPHNWRKGLHYSRVTNSLQRHLNEFNAGNDIDEETGLRHVDHILCNALFLSGITKEHPEMDDRFRSDNSK